MLGRGMGVEWGAGEAKREGTRAYAGNVGVWEGGGASSIQGVSSSSASLKVQGGKGQSMEMKEEGISFTGHTRPKPHTRGAPVH